MKGTNKLNNKQKGFTIIELVVVILLLGILTATALPRFMDVQDEAHDAVVNGVLGGLRTSAALFRAQWMAEGQPGTVLDYASMRASRTGYPMGTFTGATPSSIPTSTDCKEIFDNLLQAGAPDTGIKSAVAGALASVKAATTAFVAYLDKTDSTTKKECTYAYTGEFNDTSAGGVPVITYDSGAGSFTLETAEL